MPEQTTGLPPQEVFDFLLEAEAEFYASAHASALRAIAASDPEVLSNYTTNYIGSKQKLLGWIWDNTPKSSASVFDGFSGSGVVAYMYKRKGLAVQTNDVMRYPYHISRAIIENQTETLTPDDIETLLANNPKAGNFVQTNFGNAYFGKGIHPIIDNIRANVEKFSGYKKDLAFFALGKTCITMKSGFGHFGSVGKEEHAKTPEQFTQAFRMNCTKISQLVFEGKECKANQGQTVEVAKGVKADVAYYDPPYATQFSTTNYEMAYHFVEGLMVNWEGREIRQESKLKTFKPTVQTVTRANAGEFFRAFLGASAHFGCWLISYRDKAFPNEEEMKQIVADLGRGSSLEAKDHSYHISAKRGDASFAKEYLFICKQGSAGKQASEDAEAGKKSRNTSKGEVLADPEAAWSWDWASDADALVEYDGWGALADACAFVDLEYDTEDFDGVFPMVKDAYKLPFKKVVDDEVTVFWKGVVAAMNALLGARGGVDLTDEQKQAAYEALVPYYPLFDQEPPEPAWASKKAEEEAPVEQAAASAPVVRMSTSGDYPMHTRVVAEFALVAEADQPKASGDPEDKAFEFILCHVGTNRNGDHFLREELAANYRTIIAQKVNLKHSQEMSEIVGDVYDSSFGKQADGKEGIRCLGRIHTKSAPLGAHAYKLMKTKVVAQVSMECDYQEGECSYCGQRIKSKAEYCEHLRTAKGRKFNGKEVYEILHGVRFTGVGLLDREGADEDARILRVAHHSKEETTMPDPKETPKGTTPDAEAKQPPMDDPAGGAPPVNDVPAPKTPPAPAGGDKDKQIADLQAENKSLKDQVDKLKQKVAELEKSQRETDQKQKVASLFRDLEDSGLKVFETAEERDAEVDVLSKMAEEAFNAALRPYERMKQANPGGQGAQASQKTPAPAAAASAPAPAPMSANATRKPFSVDDPANDNNWLGELRTGLNAVSDRDVAGKQ